MFCDQCGTKLNEGAKFCSNCGHTLTGDAPKPVQGNAQKPVHSEIIGYIEAKVRLGIAIAINVITALMFAFSWFEISGLSIAENITGMSIGGGNGITIFDAFGAISGAMSPASAAGVPTDGLAFLIFILVLLLIIPVLNIISAFALFVKKQSARPVMLLSSIYTLAVGAFLIIYILIYNIALSGETSGMASMFLGITLHAPAYITALLGLAGIFAAPKSSKAPRAIREKRWSKVRSYPTFERKETDETNDVYAEKMLRERLRNTWGNDWRR
jgi:uncharacterized membrane protein